MLDNHVYNLIQQLAEESKTAWRTTQYINDAGDCDPCRSFWQKLKADKDDHINDLSAMIQQHLHGDHLEAAPQKSATRETAIAR